MSRSLVVLAAVCALLAVAVFAHTGLSERGWARRRQLRSELAAIKGTNDALRDQIKKAQRDIKALRTRREVQMQAVREEFGYLGADEVVVDFGGSIAAF